MMSVASKKLKKTEQIVATGIFLLVTANANADAMSDYELGRKAFHNDDLIAAMQHLERAAQSDHVDAMLLLGYILDQAEENTTALGYYRRAFDLGSAEAGVALGKMYVSGDGVEKDKEQALDWYQRAADRGNREAMTILGQAYVNGELGLSVDRGKGKKLLERAAADGHEPARLLLEQNPGTRTN